MRNKIVVAVLAAVSFMTLSAFRGGCHRVGHDPEHVDEMVTDRVDDFLDRIDATDAQRSQVMTLKDQLVPDGLKLSEGNRAARRELYDVLASETPEASRLHALVDDRIDAFRAFGHKLADAALEVHRILTPEQRQEIREKVRKRMERHQ